MAKAAKVISIPTACDLSKRKLWETEHKMSKHHHTAITAAQRTFTICYKLPLNTMSLESLMINGVLVYDIGTSAPKRTAVIGGGGRFELRKRFYDGECVACELMLRDVCYYTKKKPTFKCVIGVKP